MGSKWIWVFSLLIFVSLQGSVGRVCWERERIALLKLKHSINSTYYLQNWVEGEENSDCCQWSRVECNHTTGRVMKIYLSYVRKLELGEWYLNTSLFSIFQELEYLDLSWNGIAGWVENKGLERQSRFNRLEVLDLTGNFLNNSILSSLAGLKSLKALYLNQNRLKGTINVQVLKSLSNLEELDMTGNQIVKFVFPKGYRGLRNLNTLYLGNLRSTDGRTLLQSLGSFSSLKKLDLGSSNFRCEAMNTQELRNFTNLEELILDDSFLHISMLRSIGAFTSLKCLSMKNCKLNGILPNQGILNFKNLKSLFMDGTTLNSSLSEIIKPMASLEILSLSNCGLTGELQDQGLCKLKQLKELYIDYNDLNGTLPWCFANFTSLQLLDISSNLITGDITSSPLKDLISLQDLRLSSNHFRIPISLEAFFNHSRLKKFYGMNNQIYAEIESHSLAPKFQLNSFKLSGYGDGGTFPKFLHHQHDLREVDLSHINLNGQFPNWLLENNTELETLLLVNNSLSGPFWLPIHSHQHLTKLDISVNFFNGQIPKEVGAYLPRLISLNISSNSFNDSIPSSIGDMNSLRNLDLSHNQFSGEVPEHLSVGCFSLQLLVLSDNSLQGHVFSKNFNLTNLKSLHLDNNHFIGQIPESLSNCSLLGLNLGNNHFFGKIPGWLGNTSGLKDLVMPHNQLEGQIPMEFCQLHFLEVLDLSDNNISGSLPSCFMPFNIKQVQLSGNRLQGQLIDAFYYSLSLVTLDLSYNLLNGSIPNWIGRLSLLRVLSLRKNNLEGELPLQLCELDELRVMDLSSNNFIGFVLPCLKFTELHEKGYAATTQDGPANGIDEYIEFTTNKGNGLTNMHAIDLSCNKLIGEIPRQLGNFTILLVLNLSHNNLTGRIPLEFSNLKTMEVLDLSYNSLNGRISLDLTKLLFLCLFNVSYNNLSGKIPMAAQFGTFDNSSYEGNPLLCGSPLLRDCGIEIIEYNKDESTIIDMGIFYISFIVSYSIMLSGVFIVLYVNPYWRQTWFFLVEKWMISSYYCIIDHFL